MKTNELIKILEKSLSFYGDVEVLMRKDYLNDLGENKVILDVNIMFPSEGDKKILLV